MSLSGKVLNQHYDEAVDLSDDLDESIDTHAQSASQGMSPAPSRQRAAAAAGGGGGGDARRANRMVDSPPDAGGDSMDDRAEYDDEDDGARGMGGAKAGGGGRGDYTGIADSGKGGGGSDGGMGGSGGNGGSSGGPGDLGGGGGGGGGGPTTNPGVYGVPPKAATYDPSMFNGLKVPDEIRDIFDLIGRYRPPTVELDTRLKCFVPDFIPAVGGIDPFIKPPPPSLPAGGAVKEETELGLTVVDEPSASQSDPTVLELRLRALSKKGGGGGTEAARVRALEHAAKNPKEITKWIASIEELHKAKPPPQVHYARPMPEVEALMQEWPSSFDTSLSSLPLPPPDLDVTTEDYARLACALLDVPVYGSALIPSLHHLFTLYNDFMANQHFSNAAGAAGGAGGGSSGGPNMAAVVDAALGDH